MHVLFLCPHGAAKSVVAAALLGELARRSDLDFTASSAGTDPDAAVDPAVRQALRRRGLRVPDAPRRVTEDDMAAADLVVSLGCPLADLPGTPSRFADWPDVPSASADLDGLIRTLSERLPALIDAMI